MIFEDSDVVYLDPGAAHGTGDPSWERNLKNCIQCLATRQAIWEAGGTPPAEGEPWPEDEQSGLAGDLIF